MPPTRHNTTVTPWVKTTTATPSKPTRTDGTPLVVGDALIAYIFFTGTNVSIAPPTSQGWLSLDRVDRGVGLPSAGVAVFYKYITAADAAITSYTFTTSAVDAQAATLTAFSGVRSVNPVDKMSMFSTFARLASVTALSITPSRSNGILMAGNVLWAGTLTKDTTLTPPVETPAWVELYDTNNTFPYRKKVSGNWRTVHGPAHIAELATKAAPAGGVPTGDKTFLTSPGYAGDYRASLMISVSDTVITPRSLSFNTVPALIRDKVLKPTLAFRTFTSGVSFAHAFNRVSIASRVFMTAPFFGMGRNVLKSVNFTAAPALDVNKVVAAIKRFSAPTTLSKTVRAQLFKPFESVPTVESFKTFNKLHQFIQPTVHAADGIIERFTSRFRNVAKRLAGLSGPVGIRYKIYKSDQFATKIALLNNALNGEVTVSNYRDHAWELKVSIKGTDPDIFDPMVDYVFVTGELRVEGDTWQEFPLGLYRFESPTGVHYETHTQWDLTGRSPEWMLAADMPTTGYSVAAGTGVLVAVKKILTDFGIPANRIVLPTRDKALVTGMQWSLAQDADGTSWLRICNALLAAGGFYGLQCDAYGRFVTYDIVNLDQKPTDVYYGPSHESMVLPGAQDDWDDENFANKVIVISQDVNQTPPITAVAIDDDPNSPSSIDNLGRVQTKLVSQQNITSQAVANTLALDLLQRATSYHRKVTITTLPDLRRGLREVYEVHVNNKLNKATATPLRGRWHVTNWKLPLSDPPKEMTHEITKLQKVHNEDVA